MSAIVTLLLNARAVAASVLAGGGFGAGSPAAWGAARSYVEWLVVYSLGLGVVSLWGLRHEPFAEALGVLAAAIEATIAWPLIYRNYARRGNAAGLSGFMVMSWVLGDSAKLW